MAISSSSSPSPASPDAPPSASAAADEPRKACHQCRQMKPIDHLANCGSSAAARRPCPVSFCYRCLLNRYREKVEEDPNWRCPKCRGVCNCSVCMKRKGQKPTGVVAQTAKKTGLGSVLDWLRKNQPVAWEAKDAAMVEKPAVSTMSLKRKEPEEDSSVQGGEVVHKRDVASTSGDDNKKGHLQGKWGEGSFEGSMNMDKKNTLDSGGIGSLDPKLEECSQKIEKMGLEKPAASKAEIDPKKMKLRSGYEGNPEEVCGAAQPGVGAHPLPKVIKLTKRVTGNKYVADKKALPQGNELMTVAGIDLMAADVGAALQLLEFCAAFGNFLGLTKGQPELLLRELLCGRAARWVTKNSLVAQFHIRLLPLLHKDAGERPQNINEKSWLQDLKRYISRSQTSLDFLDGCTSGYDNLEPSKKLRILNFLCDEVLGTECIRSLIEEEQVKYVKRKRQERERCLSEKEDCLRNQQDNAQPHLSDKEDCLPNQQGDAKTPKNSLVESLPKTEKKRRSDAVRTEAFSIDESGRAFWKLKGCCNSSRIVLQDIKNLDKAVTDDKWFVYDDEQENVIKEHISSIKNWRLRKHRESMRQALIREQGHE